MIGEKRVTSEFSSSRSREREIVKKNKNPLFMKNKEIKERNSARKIKGGNINKDFVKKYTAGALEVGKVKSQIIFMCYILLR